jgi:uncharacterized protein (TIGR03435 family)
MPLLAALWISAALHAAIGQQNSAPSEATPSTPPTYEVASIRQNLSDQHARSHIYSSPDNARFSAINAPLKMLLQFAFALPESQISGVPAALGSEKFDIEARADTTVDDLLHKLPSDRAKLVKQQMLQSLLADRFKLTSHQELKQLPVFDLVQAKTGPKLQASRTGSRMFNFRHGQLEDQGATTAVLAEQLAQQLGRPVIDKTTLTGSYDLNLKWSPDDSESSPDASGPSLFTALQEQLGLKLESTKGPVQTLVIDHIEPPSEN